MSRKARQIETSRVALPVGERDHIRGPATARVTLVECGDPDLAEEGLESRLQQTGKTEHPLSGSPLGAARPLGVGDFRARRGRRLALP